MNRMSTRGRYYYQSLLFWTLYCRNCNWRALQNELCTGMMTEVMMVKWSPPICPDPNMWNFACVYTYDDDGFVCSICKLLSLHPSRRHVSIGGVCRIRLGIGEVAPCRSSEWQRWLGLAALLRYQLLCIRIIASLPRVSETLLLFGLYIQSWLLWLWMRSETASNSFRPHDTNAQLESRKSYLSAHPTLN